jgi:hypothetical protein
MTSTRSAPRCSGRRPAQALIAGPAFRERLVRSAGRVLGLSVRSAQIGRVPRGMAHLWGRERLSAETIALLRAVGDSISRHVVTDVLPIEQAPGLLDALARRKRHVLQAVFTFGDDLPATAP